MIRCHCPRCKSVLKTPDRAAGQKLPCPRCGQGLRQPALPRNKTVLAPLLPPAARPSKPHPAPASWGRRGAAYAVLAILAGLTLDGKIRLAVWVFLAGLALRTIIAYKAHED